MVVAAGETEVDSLVMNRMYTFLRNYSDSVENFTTNVYTKHLYQVHKRNPTIWVVPSMYTIANGQREFVSEEYSRFTFTGIDKYKNKKQVYCTTIPRNKRIMSVLLKYLTPNFYNVTIYEDHILSPFSQQNRIYYQYKTVKLSNHQVRLYFKPRYVRNTQLVRGKAIIDERTGRIEQVEMDGEFDMITFQTLCMLGGEGPRALLPKICQTNIEFIFGGNHITSQFEAVFDCPITLNDTVDVKGDFILMDSIRPMSLSKDEIRVYEEYKRRKHINVEEEEPQEDSDTIIVTKAWEKVDDTQHTPHKSHHNYLKEIGWDIIGDNLLRSIKTQSDKGYVKLSPILNPQYISYSQSKGLSYKLKLGTRYKFSNNAQINFNPQLGYNFKYREFYYTLPVHMIYNQRINAGIEAKLGNNNRIGSSIILDELKKKYGELPELDKKDLALFDDNYFLLKHHIQPIKWLRIETGVVFHKREAVNSKDMRNYGQQTKYYSLSPVIGITMHTGKNLPTLSIDYERGLNVNSNYLSYERWEADASMKHTLSRTRLLNMRVGGGLYTKRKNDLFMDFSNFRDNNLPDGWDDDWTGNFQLLKSRMYNESKYYFRYNISYETPLLAAYAIPVVGRYVERERIYLSSLSIEHTRLYSELGYGFTCRYFSMGIFSSFINTEFKDLGCKFTFELFRRW